MKSLVHNIRFYVLTGSIALAVVIYFWVMLTTTEPYHQIVQLVEIFGLLSLVYLYVTLLAGPFCFTFRLFPFCEQYLKARRALGVSTFYFGFLHTVISFFGQLGGFSGLGFLDDTLLFAVWAGFVALFIFSLLAITSFDYAVKKLSFPRWKLLQRFVYLAGILILVHVVMLGSHYSILSGVVPNITFLALSFLFLLEAPRFDTYLRKLPIPSQLSTSFAFTVIVLGVIFFTIIHPLTSSGGEISFDIHAAHRQLAQQSLQQCLQDFKQSVLRLPMQKQANR